MPIYKIRKSCVINNKLVIEIVWLSKVIVSRIISDNWETARVCSRRFCVKSNSRPRTRIRCSYCNVMLWTKFWTESLPLKKSTIGLVRYQIWSDTRLFSDLQLRNTADKKSTLEQRRLAWQVLSWCAPNYAGWTSGCCAVTAIRPTWKNRPPRRS